MRPFEMPTTRRRLTGPGALLFPLLFATPFLPGCSGAAGLDDSDSSIEEAQAIDLNPATLDEATVSLARLDDLERNDPLDTRLPEYRDRLERRLDELNHLVARIEPSPGHFVSFYEVEPGSVLVAERGSSGQARLLGGEETRGLSMVDLYRHLSGTEAPPALAKAEQRRPSPELTEDIELREAALATESGGVLASTQADTPATEGESRSGTVQQALGAGDGPFFETNGCFDGGNFVDCHPDWGGGGFAQALTKTSFFTIAPFSGNGLTVRFQRSGGTLFQQGVANGQWIDLFGVGVNDPLACFPVACSNGNGDYLKRTHRWDILNAAGEGFHWSYAFKWTCTTQNSCDNIPR